MGDKTLQPIEVFFSYSRKDKELRDELDTHLALLKRRGITTWHDCQIVAGSEWEEEINRRIKTADIILLLISSDFIASNYCYEKELPDILKRHEAREVYVIPVLLRPVAGWRQSPFAKLQICPAGGLPVTQWKDKDTAFVDVADSIEEAVNQLLERRNREWQEQERRVQERPRIEQEQQRQVIQEDKESQLQFKLHQPDNSASLRSSVTNASASDKAKSTVKLEPETPLLLEEILLAPIVKPSVIILSRFEFEAVTVDVAGREISRNRRQVDYFEEDLGDGVILNMVAILGGKFQMGSNERDREKPIHPVIIAPFFMGRFAVTQAQYQAVMGNNPSSFKGKNCPVEQVSWAEAIVFCQQLSQKTGNTYRLPSEAEWEYACRAGSVTPFYFGQAITTDLVNYDSKQTTNVGSFSPNAFGLYDMHGNVSEWCLDHWHKNYIGSPLDGSAWLGRRNNQFHVSRGGSWGDLIEGCRSAFRSSKMHKDKRDQYLGFRVVSLFSKEKINSYLNT